MSSEERRSFMLSMTLTELALVLFFLLLMLSVYQLKLKDEAIQALGGMDSKLVPVLPALSKWMEDNEPEDFVELLRTEEAGDDARQQLEAEVSRLKERNDDLARSADTLQEQLKQNESTQANLGGQLKNCQRQIKGGNDLPPCWADPETGKAEYIYRIEVREDDVAVNAHWPPHREDDVKRLPGAVELLSPSIGMAALERGARPLLEWSKRQDPECRFYVVIDDAAKTKDGYKNKRLAIEDYFYKFEVRR